MAQESGEPAGMAATSTWTALRHTFFRYFWAFSFVAFIGASMQSVGAGWLMTQLDPSPQKVSLVQAAFSMSALVMALPAGVLADLLDRRLIMIAALSCLMALAGLLGVVTLNGAITPLLLIALTFLFGLAAATITPALQATTLDLVPRANLASALTLNGMSTSVARAIGPGIAGLILGSWGAGWTFVANVLTFVGLLVVLLLWRNPPRSAEQSRQRFKLALREGVTFSLAQPPLRRLLLKMSLNFLMISILLALVPLVVSEFLDSRPQTLGLLLACFGVGSVSGSLLLHRAYSHLSRSRVIDIATVLHACAILLIGLSSNRYVSAAAMLFAGLSWTAMMTSVNIVAQLLLPARMRARGLSINLMAMMGSLALGAVIWGQVAALFGLRDAFLFAATGGLLMTIITSRMILGEQLDEARPRVAESA